MASKTLDDRDHTIVTAREAAFLRRRNRRDIRVGDVVVFPNGTERRVAYVWPHGVQTTDGGSFYLGDGYMSYSGSLFDSVPLTALSHTGGELSARSAWIFHHDQRRAHNGVECVVSVPVWRCSVDAPTY